MKLTNEQIQEILDGTPEGATHVNCYEGDCVYLCMNGWMWLQYTGKDWFDVNEEPLMHYIGFNNLSDLREILELRQEVASKAAEVERLRAEREITYEKWQATYQQLKDGMTLSECYECGTKVHELSPRSRCCMCEYGRANFNERENNQLREKSK